MSAQLLGFGVNTIVPKGARLRIVFGPDVPAYIEVLSYPSSPADMFVNAFPGAQDSITAMGQVIPVSWPILPLGSSAATVDGLNNAQRSGGALVAALETAVSGSYVGVRSVQLLTGSIADHITGAVGAAERDAAALAQKTKDEANKLGTQLADFLGTTLTVVKWGAALIALIAIVYLVHEGEKL